MGKPSGFMDWEREGAKKRSVEERTGDFREFYLPLAPEASTQQAGRCMDCGVAFCHQGCPLGNVIPDFNEHVYRGRWRQAWEVLSRTNDFPEFTGRLCPAPCEAACVLAIDGGAVSIEQLEKEIIERAFAEGWVQPRTVLQRTGKRVAVVGSGPAGMAAASRLNRLGHSVEVLERDDRLGGLLRYGIPDFKLEKSIIDRRMTLLEAEGIVFRTGVDVGRSPTWTELKASYDAVVVAVGARRARALDVPGAQAQGVIQAMDYLEAQNRAVALSPWGEGQGRGATPSTLSAEGLRVVILGGGDTGSDCLGTAHRQKAASVAQVELLPQPSAKRAPSNPWPNWPFIFRTSSSQEEGGDRLFGRRTTQVEVVEGKVAALHWVDVRSAGGRLEDVAGSEARVPVDLVIQAMGFLGPELGALREQLGVDLNARGNLKVDPQFRSSVPGVYGGGDASRGASLIVWAIADGRDLAKQVDRFLSSSPLPAGRGEAG